MSDTAPAKRRYIVHATENGEFDRGHAVSLLADLEAVLSAVGGTIIIAAQRAKIDQDGDQPVAITTRLVIDWRAHSPLPLEDWTTERVAAVAAISDSEEDVFAAEIAAIDDDADLGLDPELYPDLAGTEA